MGRIIDSVERILIDGLVAVSVLCGPALWLIALLCGRLMWSEGITADALLGCICLTFVSVAWAFWGIVAGPKLLRWWWFGLAALLNMAGGVMFIEHASSASRLLGLLFLGYSLWQMFVFRRK